MDLFTKELHCIGRMIANVKALMLTLAKLNDYIRDE